MLVNTWPMAKLKLQHNERAMIRQICSIKPEDVATVRSSEILAKDLDFILREKVSLVWTCDVKHSSGAVRTACDIQVEDRWGRGAKLTWKKLTENNCRDWS